MERSPGQTDSLPNAAPMIAARDYLLVLLPEVVAPVEPEVPLLLEVPDEDGEVEDGAADGDEEPEDDVPAEPVPEVELELLGALVEPVALVPVAPVVPELLVAPEAEGVVAVDGEAEPLDVPDAEPIPEVEPDAVPVAVGPDDVHAPSASAQVNARISLLMKNSYWEWKIGLQNHTADSLCVQCVEIDNGQKFNFLSR